ncbi:MAG: ABC transporter permease, partial [Desulfomonile tiedjei]|nr:ABC transporter permease [Desulfomonile tiedjei]
MLLVDLLETSFRQVYRNRRRYKGAVLGTALGIAGLITVMAVGDSVEGSIGKNLEVLGSATIIKAQWDYRSQMWHVGQYYPRDINDLRRLPGVLQVAPTTWKMGQEIAYQKTTFKVRVGAVEANFFDTIYLPVARGRKMSIKDVQDRRSVCIIGDHVKKELFGDEDPLGKAVTLHGLSLEVIGILGGAEDPDYVETVLLPLSTAGSRLKGMKEITDIYIRAVDWDTAPVLHNMVSDLLKANQPGYAENMQVTYYADRIAAIKTVVLIFKLFLYGAILVTLILGGLGITNVMLAIVHERTREIGLREALGATERMIMSQFLAESLSVSLIGAIIGILVGFLVVQKLQ